MAENVSMGSGAALNPSAGSVGLPTQLPGQATTVSNVAAATGGIAPGNFVETDIDEQLFAFKGDDTALMNLMLSKVTRKVKVNSPEVEHYMIDEQRSKLTTASAVAQSNNNSFVLPLLAKDQNIPRDYHTLLIKGVDGYAADGTTVTPGHDLMVFVTGRDSVTNNPVVRAVNGPKTSSADMYCTTPAIPAGTQVILLGNALYETQKEVDPDLIIPMPTIVYLQKRGMNQVVSDYYDAQAKHIPFAQKVIAEQAIANFKRAGNRTLWAGRKGKLTVNVPKLGEQFVYFTEGIRYQFKRELQHSGKWSIEELMGMAKMFFTGEDVPTSATLLAGNGLLEQLQCIDYSGCPQVTLLTDTHPVGWSVTKIHTVWGDIYVKRDPTLDSLGWSNSGALLGDGRLVHYTYSSQHEFNDRVEGEEATRKGMVVWDGLGMKGSCHVWIDGEEESQTNKNAVAFKMWASAEAPASDDLSKGMVYYLLADCPGISAQAKQSQVWQAAEVTVSYSKTSDAAIAAGKTYYTKSGDVYTAVATPVPANISNYYEKSVSATWKEFTGEVFGQ